MSDGGGVADKWVHKTLSKVYKRWRYYFVIDDNDYVLSETAS